MNDEEQVQNIKSSGLAQGGQGREPSKLNRKCKHKGGQVVTKCKNSGGAK